MKKTVITNLLPKLVFAPQPFTYSLQKARLAKVYSLFDLPYLQHVPSQAFYYPSSYGYHIHGKIFLTPHPSENYIILFHGYYANQYESVSLAPLFLKLGYNVITVDSRHHGKNTKSFVSFGIYERKDFKLLIDYLMPKLAKEARLGVFGHSLGAAIALQTAAIDPRIDFVIASAPFNRLDETLLAHFLYRKQTWLTTEDWRTFYLAAQKLYKLNFANLDIASSVTHLQCPVLYLHGLEDRQNPTYMSAELHALTPHSAFFTFKDTTHNTIFTRNYAEATLIIEAFLDYVAASTAH
ncbi:MAG: alpha/beta hydrolase [Culicoidibacterales bacterium]